MKIALPIFLVTAACVFSGCRTEVVNKHVVAVTDPPKGVRWIESKPYHIYVYVGHTTKGKDKEGNTTTISSPKIVYFGTTNLLDKVNGLVLDANPEIWDINYRGDIFASGVFNIELNNDGSLKSAGIDTGSGSNDSGSGGSGGKGGGKGGGKDSGGSAGGDKSGGGLKGN